MYMEIESNNTCMEVMKIHGEDRQFVQDGVRSLFSTAKFSLTLNFLLVGRPESVISILTVEQVLIN
jgi:hypothetical protein